MRGMGIVLVGYRGSGKTTVGRMLADRLGAQFVDLDDRITAKAGKTIREIFDQLGEPAFREMESAALGEVLGEAGEGPEGGKAAGMVLSLGGGAVERELNRGLLERCGRRVVYLRCEAEQLFCRISADPQTRLNRPNLTRLGGGIEEIAALLSRREPMYRQIAHHEIDVSRLSVEQVVREIVSLLGKDLQKPRPSF